MEGFRFAHDKIRRTLWSLLSSHESFQLHSEMLWLAEVNPETKPSLRPICDSFHEGVCYGPVRKTCWGLLYTFMRLLTEAWAAQACLWIWWATKWVLFNKNGRNRYRLGVIQSKVEKGNSDQVLYKEKDRSSLARDTSTWDRSCLCAFLKMITVHHDELLPLICRKYLFERRIHNRQCRWWCMPHYGLRMQRQGIRPTE